MSINAYPLQWPVGWKRTEPSWRQVARFSGSTRKYTDTGSYRLSRDLTIAEGRQRVLQELTRMGLQRDDVVISTNLPLRLDGEPRGDAREPADPGVAIYWQESTGARRVMAIDIYTLLAPHNVRCWRAVIAPRTLDAMRAIERHGGQPGHRSKRRAVRTGFTALPAPGGSASTRSWREVLGFDNHHGQISAELLRERFRSRASSAHPDKGGTDAEMSELNIAYERAKEELGL